MESYFQIKLTLLHVSFERSTIPVYKFSLFKGKTVGFRSGHIQNRPYQNKFFFRCDRTVSISLPQ